MKARAAIDMEYAERLRARNNEILKRFRAAVAADPARAAAYRQKWFDYYRNRTPEQIENKRAYNRAWYASLTPEEKRLYIYEIRRRRATEALRAVGENPGDE